MNFQETTTRRTLLKAALGLGLALSIGARAHAAANPFASGQVWGGLTSGPLANSDGTIQLNVSSPSSGVLLCGYGAIGVMITFDNIDSVTITGSFLPPNALIPNKLVITGKMPPVDLNNPTLTPKFAPSAAEPNYTVSNIFGVLASGTVELSQHLLVGPAIDPLADNRASLDTFPPDLFGKFITSSEAVGPITFHRNTPAPSREPASLNKATGVVTINDTRFSFLMTFSSYPEADGTFRFDLIGDTGRVGGPILVLSGRLTPASLSALVPQPARMAGNFQMFLPRGGALVPLVTARYLMTQVA